MKKDNMDENEDTFSDYEDLLSGFSTDKDDETTGGESEDKEMLSELLDGVDSQDDRETHDENTFNLEALENLSIDEVTTDADDDSSEKTNSGKFEIEVDDENIDYASILNEIEGSKDTETSFDADVSEEAGEPIELDIAGSSNEETEESTSGEDESGAGSLEEDLLKEFLEEVNSEETHESEDESDSAGDTDTELTGHLDELAELDISEYEADMELNGSGAVSTGEFSSLMEEETVEQKPVAQDVSYTSFISDDDRSSEDDEIIDIEPVSDDTETGEYTLSVDTDETPADGIPSYASFIDDEQEATIDESGLATDDDSDKQETFASIVDEDYSLDAADLDISLDDTDFSLTEDDATPDSDKVSQETDSFEVSGIVVNGGDISDTGDVETDFLGVDDTSTPTDDSFLGVSDITEEKMPEVMLDGIEMDITAQTSAVTRAELYLAQGKRDEAAAVYTEIAEEGGVTPFVAMRMKQLGLDIPATQREAEELAEQ